MMSNAVATFKGKSEGEVDELIESVQKLEESEDSSFCSAEAVRDQRTKHQLRANDHSKWYTGTGKEVNGRRSFGISYCTATLKIICGILLFVISTSFYLAGFSFIASTIDTNRNTSNLTVAYIISDGAASSASNVAASIIAAAGTFACAGIPICVGMAANTMAAVRIPVSVKTRSCATPSGKSYTGSMSGAYATGFMSSLNFGGSTGHGGGSIADILCMVFIIAPLPPAPPPPPPPDFLDDMNPGNPQHVNHLANNENDEFEENVVEPVLQDSPPHKDPPPPPRDHLD